MPTRPARLVPAAGPGRPGGLGPGRAGDHAARRRETARPRRIGQTVLVSLACLPAVLVAGRLFDAAGYLPPLLGAVALAALVGATAGRRLASTELVGVAGLVSGIAYGLATTGGHVGPLVRGLRDGWPGLLAAAVPAQPRALLLVPLGALLWVSAFLAVVLVVRGDNPLLPLVGPLLGLVGVLVVVGSAGRDAPAAGWHPSPVLLTGAFVALGMAAAAPRAARRSMAVAEASAGLASPAGDAAGTAQRPPAGAGGPRRVRSGPVSVGLVIVVAVALLATVIGRFVPVASRFDPRDHWYPAPQSETSLNPLVRVRAQLTETEPRDLFTVRMTNTGAAPRADPATGKPAAPVDRVRIAALGDFDGATWRDDDRYVRVDRALPAADDPLADAVPRASVRADVTVAALDGGLLPTFGQPTSVGYRPALAGGAGGLVYQPGSGALAGLSGSVAGDRVQLTTQVPVPTAAQLRAATPGTGPLADRYRQLPDKPSWLDAEARTLAGTAGTPYARLTALATALRDDYPYDLSASPGHSYGVLALFLSRQQPGDGHGYAEQHAAAFAVLARALGFPTRVAVGYLLDARTEAADGTFTVTSWQAHAWPEVLLVGLGWVPFEPTDVHDLRRLAPEQETTPIGGGSTGPLPDTKLPELPRVDPGLDDTGHLSAGGAHHSVLVPVLAATLGPVALLLLALLAIVAEKARRRLARRRGAPAARVRGAWREARDRLAELGVPRSAALTHREIVWLALELPATASTAAPSGPLRRLAVLAARARYGGPAGEAAADAGQAWLLADEISRELRRRNGWARSARARLDPRPLLPPPRGRDRSPAPAPTRPDAGLSARPATGQPPRPRTGQPPWPGTTRLPDQDAGLTTTPSGGR
ncbi:transglutaminase domain-containing protein [Frankia sp. AgB1.9]|uniref:DUF3488 and transglutaminase-like domain-containing protein n=2 Tax=unclassified Frankia TaxID=2632575 RepID=UPI001933617A|nr:transglutaminase domain-containing protein [Frankia sp. AgB1.9]MBL7551762.1 transglutaminase domain-containing protein [Frankia sp. AgB1.9]